MFLIIIIIFAVLAKIYYQPRLDYKNEELILWYYERIKNPNKRTGYKLQNYIILYKKD